jgi:hypothetical protein
MRINLRTPPTERELLRKLVPQTLPTNNLPKHIHECRVGGQAARTLRKKYLTGAIFSAAASLILATTYRSRTPGEFVLGGMSGLNLFGAVTANRLAKRFDEMITSGLNRYNPTQINR